MRLRGRTDANQSKIVKELRLAGCSVASTSDLGMGFPDVLVGVGGVNHWCEIKDPNQPPSKRRLTPDEKAFHETWRGKILIIHSVEEFLRQI